MCRMVGVVFRGKFPMDTLGDLREVARDGRVPGQDHLGHTDGWGMVSYSNGWPRYIGRSARSLSVDTSFDSALRDVTTLSPPNVLIAHARAASAGEPAIQNSHPFVEGRTVFAHNGTVRGLKPPAGREPKGGSDSEVLSMILAERLEEETELASALRSVIREDIAKHDFTGAVLLVSDGEKLIGYRDFKDTSMASYYDLRIAACGDSTVLFQETRCGYRGEVSQVAKGEMVSVDKELRMERQQVL